MNSTKIVFGLILLLFFAGCVQQPVQPTQKNPELCFVNAGKCIQIEKAVSVQEQILGLSFRESLPEGTGMLFPLEKETIPGFWMKDMEFAIDIVWIDSGNSVVGWAPKMQPCTSEICETVSPLVPISYVLEVNAGFMEENGIQAGDKVRING